jgi:hypothetical protein
VVSSEDIIRQSNKNKGKGKAKSKQSKELAAVLAEVEAERSALLSAKQTELTAVVDRHDDLVCRPPLESNVSMSFRR